MAQANSIGMNCDEKSCKVNGTCPEVSECGFIKQVLSKLADYENTEINPEQIVEMDKFYLAKCEEANQLRAELEALRNRLPQFEIGDIAYIADFEAGVIDCSEVNGIVCRIDDGGTEYEYDSDLLEFFGEDVGVIVFKSRGEAQEAIDRREM